MIPSPGDIHNQLPLKPPLLQQLLTHRAQAEAIVQGTDPRKVIIVGPCSIHDKSATFEYARRLKELSDRVANSLFLVMRVYVEKPRTALGWKGLIYDPHLDGSHDIITGIAWTREILLELIEMNIPIATEFVDPIISPYFQDLVTWGFIGARTSASQPHRQLASSLPYPVGFKNSLEGRLDIAINGVLSARHSHHFLQINNEGRLSLAQSQGNPLGHIVLRGACTHHNYDRLSVSNALKSLQAAHLKPHIMIDCAHGNSNKEISLQKQAFYAVLEQIASGSYEIFGLMLESHLEEGSQTLSEDPSELKRALSITDPCLSFATTEELILDIASLKNLV